MEGKMFWRVSKKVKSTSERHSCFSRSWTERHKLTGKGDVLTAFCWTPKALSLYVVTPPLPVTTTPPVNICGPNTESHCRNGVEEQERGLEMIRRKGRAKTELTTVAAQNPDSGSSAPHLLAHVNVDPGLYHTLTAASLDTLLCKQQLRSP